MLKLIKHNLGIYFMLIACVYFALTGACAKILSETLPSIEVVFFRNLVGTIFVLYLISKLKIKKEGGHIGLLIFRGVAGTISLYAFFYNVANIELGTAFAFQKTAPIFVALIAFFIFKESIGFFGSLGILLAFCGVLLISHPWIDDELHTGVDMTNTLIGVFSGLTAAMALTDNSVSIDDPRLAAEPRLAIVMGTEGDGLPCETIAEADYVVRIPMSHGVDSLNVAAASAVAFWQLRARES